MLSSESLPRKKLSFQRHLLSRKWPLPTLLCNCTCTIISTFRIFFQFNLFNFIPIYCFSRSFAYFSSHTNIAFAIHFPLALGITDTLEKYKEFSFRINFYFPKGKANLLIFDITNTPLQCEIG